MPCHNKDTHTHFVATLLFHTGTGCVLWLLIMAGKLPATNNIIHIQGSTSLGGRVNFRQRIVQTYRHFISEEQKNGLCIQKFLSTLVKVAKIKEGEKNWRGLSPNIPPSLQTCMNNPRNIFDIQWLIRIIIRITQQILHSII